MPCFSASLEALFFAGSFQTSTGNIGLHLRNIYDDGELVETATTEKSSVVPQEGRRRVRRAIKHHNLDAIIGAYKTFRTIIAIAATALYGAFFVKLSILAPLLFLFLGVYGLS